MGGWSSDGEVAGAQLTRSAVMTGFGGSAKGSIEVLDLDTIDLSNLNRQFLFQKQHVKRPKAVVRWSRGGSSRVEERELMVGRDAQVAKETALKFNPNINIKALHRNIKVRGLPLRVFGRRRD